MRRLFWKSQRSSLPERVKVKFQAPLEAQWGYLAEEIGHLILATEDFIVFLDLVNDVDWKSTKVHDAGDHENRGTFHSVLNDAATLEARPIEGLTPKMTLQFKRLIAEAVARALSDDYPNARRMIELAGAYIEARSQEISRLWYLSASAVMATVFVLVGGAVWILRDELSPLIGVGAFWLLLSSIAGSIGALASVISRTGKQQFGSASGKRLHYLEGASRIWAGAISGLVVGTAVRSGIVLSALSGDGNVHLVMILAALASGATERLATSIIADLGSVKSKTEGQGSP